MFLSSISFTMSSDDSNIFVLCRQKCEFPLHITSITHHEIINHLVKYHLYDVFDRLLDNSFLSRPENHEQKYNSCINSMYVLSCVFFGEKRAAFYLELLLDKIELGTDDGYVISGLFDGYIYHKISRYNIHDFALLSPKEQSLEIMCMVNAQLEKYLGFVEDEIFRNAQRKLSPRQKCRGLPKFLPTLNFKFNEKTLDKLGTVVRKNEAFTSTYNAHAYLVIILNSVCVEHAFIVVQSRDENQEIKYELYQSWAMKNTLHRGRPHEQGSWSLKQFEDFLHKLRLILCRDENRTQQTYEASFGYPVKGSSLVQFKDGKLKGSIIRFIPMAFDTRKCLLTIEQFMACSPVEEGI